MDPVKFREAVEDDRSAELDRIEEGPLVRAMAGGDPEPGPVLAAAASAEYAARRTFEEWAETESNDAASAAFGSTADQEREHYDRVVEQMPETGGFEPADGGPVHAYLRAREGTVPRVAAGMVGRSLVSVRSHAHVVEFFEEREDPDRAALFRDLRAETRDTLERGLALLGEIPTDDDDREVARSTAGYAVKLAHDDYAAALDGWETA
ncbi:rubrerythrin family protein [Halobacteriales archaeon QS_8_69_26]|nr:MAG: rubrerythrin family protein [Halobacteriales archaeon QS_8_69_26]